VVVCTIRLCCDVYGVYYAVDVGVGLGMLLLVSVTVVVDCGGVDVVVHNGGVVRCCVIGAVGW